MHDGNVLSGSISSSVESTITPSDLRRLQRCIDSTGPETAHIDASLLKDIEQCQSLLREGQILHIDCSSLVARSESDPMDDLLQGVELGSNRVGPEANRRYNSPEFLDAGGFGIVFSAWDELLGIPVAIKFLRPSKSASRENRYRFLAEAKIMASLSHVGIVRIFEVGQIESHLFMTMAKIEGGTLRNFLLSQECTFTPRQAAWLVAQVAEAIGYAHRSNTLHRDIKPANILLERSDPATTEQLGFRPILTDFGLAKRIDPGPDANDWTGDGRAPGTTRYMSPEQAGGNTENIGAHSDVFSLGTLLYELLVGSIPFKGRNAFEIRQSIGRCDYVRPRRINKAISSELEAIVMKCLSRDVRLRYPDGQELWLDLRRYLGDEPVLAIRSTWWRRTALQIRRRPVLSAIGALTLMANIAALLGLAVSLRNVQRALEIEKDALLVQNEARQREVAARQKQHEALQSMVSIYSKTMDKVVGGKTIELPEVLPSLNQSVVVLEQSVTDNPADLKMKHRLSVLKHYLSIAHDRNHDTAKAIQMREESLALLEALVQSEPENTTFRYQRFHSKLNLGSLLYYNGPASQERRMSVLHSARVDLEQLCNEHPEDFTYQEARVTTLQEVAKAVLISNPKESMAWFTSAIERCDELISKYPNDFLVRKSSVGARIDAALALQLADRPEEAYAMGKEAFDRFTTFFQPIEPTTELLSIGQHLYTRWERLLCLMEKWEEARPVNDENLNFKLLLFERNASSQESLRLLDSYILRIQIRSHLGDRQAVEEAMDEIRKLYQEYATVPDFRRQFVVRVEQSEMPPDATAKILDITK